MGGCLIDFDGVLADTFTAQIAAVNTFFGTSYTREDFTEWDTSNILTPEQNEFMWGEDCFLDEDFQKTCVPLASSDHLYQFVNKYIVSDRPEVLRNVTADWLQEKFSLGSRLVLTRHHATKSDQAPSIHTKSKIAYYKGLNKVVEDSPFHSLSLAGRSYIDRVYLMDTPANRQVAHDKIVRVHSWDEIITLEGEDNDDEDTYL